MNFFEFEKKLQDKPVFTSTEAKNIFFDQKNILVQIAFWTRKGYLTKVKKGVYVLAKSEKDLNHFLLASKLYSPSYLSLESALNLHGIIPDITPTFTSVTTRKTQTYQTKFGVFSYQKIKENLFTGYESFETRGGVYALANPEKALADFCYLNSGRLQPKPEFWKEMRINESFELNQARITGYKKLFDNKKVSQLIDSLVRYFENSSADFQ